MDNEKDEIEQGVETFLDEGKNALKSGSYDEAIANFHLAIRMLEEKETIDRKKEKKRKGIPEPALRMNIPVRCHLSAGRSNWLY